MNSFEKHLIAWFAVLGSLITVALVLIVNSFRSKRKKDKDKD